MDSSVFVGLFIHFMFLVSIFDIYFKSPVVSGVEPFEPQHEPVANRLVLFVVDGLRAESFVDYDTMEYLRKTAVFSGKWGISNTRVPTESRPGHVALIAGFYEDPSAVLKGWKENAVNFDSVFNQSKYTWSWGSYDIVDIFTKDAKNYHINNNKYDLYDNLLSLDQNPIKLDSWVFEHVEKFFATAQDDYDLHRKLMEKKIVLFLHLLGTDTSGHAHKPKTDKFLATITFADEGIRRTEKLVKDFYNDDGKTTFIMTSDHGMTDWGSHGAGDIHETETPFVIWGAGIKALDAKDLATYKGNLLDKNKYIINQADFAPLMSTILSIPVPVNSVGELPFELLDIPLKDKAKALYSNSRQLANQYCKKKLDVEAHAIPLLYYPYKPLDNQRYNELINIIESLLQHEKYEKVIQLSKEMIHLSLSGLQYYHNYYQIPLLAAVTISFLGWIFFLLKKITIQSLSIQGNVQRNNNFNEILKNAIFFICAIVSSYLVFVQNLPCQYYIYFGLPTILWWHVLTPLEVWKQCFLRLSCKGGFILYLIVSACYCIGVLALGLSFAFRWTLCLPLCGMALWPMTSSIRQRLSMPVLALWSGTCCLLSTFTFIPVVGKQVYIPYVILSGLVWLAVLAVTAWEMNKLLTNDTERKLEMLLNSAHFVLLLLALHNAFAQSRIYDLELPPNFYLQFGAWAIAVITFFLPFLHTKRLVCRLQAINSSIFTFYMLLSVIHEGLFLVTLIVNGCCWVFIEFKMSHTKDVKIFNYKYERSSNNRFTSNIHVDRMVNREDFRRAFFFLVYIIVAFFGTGNIASLNSFEWRWVACFVSSFHPFLISALVLMKTLSPFLCVASCFRAVQSLTQAPTGYLNVIVLIYSNVMGIQLLYNVKNTGSWLEIGTSISQFVIVQLITLFIVIIHQLASILSECSLYDSFRTLLTSNKKTL